MILIASLGVGILIVSILGFILYIFESLDFLGTIAGCIISVVVFFAGGFRWFFLLSLFVILGTLSTRFCYKEKLESDLTHGKRSIGNVIANGGVPLISAMAYLLTSSQIAAIAFSGSLAVATSDTLSSEIGSVYGNPRLMTTFEKVPKGTEGGISFQGEIAAIVGAFLVGIVGFLLGIFSFPHIFTALFGGFFGTHVDSFLGATIEGEKIGNNTVNFIACSFGSLSAIVMFYIVNYFT